MLWLLFLAKLMYAIARVVADTLKGRRRSWRTWCSEHPEQVVSLIAGLLLIVVILLEMLTKIG